MWFLTRLILTNSNWKPPGGYKKFVLGYERSVWGFSWRKWIKSINVCCRYMYLHLSKNVFAFTKSIISPCISTSWRFWAKIVLIHFFHVFWHVILTSFAKANAMNSCFFKSSPPRSSRKKKVHYFLKVYTYVAFSFEFQKFFLDHKTNFFSQ